MLSPGTRLSPDAFLEVLDHRLPEISRGYGALVTHEPDGKAVKRGTVTFCRYGTRPVILTAAHVAEQHVGRESTLLHFNLNVHGAPQLEQVQRGRRAVFRPQLVFSDADIDVACIGVPDEVADIEGLTWFDLDDCVRMTREIVAYLPEVLRDETLPVVACGFGNYGAIEDAGRRVQLFAGGPLLCELRSCDSEDDRVPQMILAPDVEPDALRTRTLNGIERDLVDRLSGWDDSCAPDHPAAFGGYSGGPVIYMSGTREHVIGIVTQGTRRPGAARILAAPMTAIVERFKR